MNSTLKNPLVYRSLFTLAFILAALTTLAAGSKPTTVAGAKIDSVRMYLSGAEVFRSETLVLQPGRNHFVFTGLSSKLYPKSIRVAAGNPDVKIRSVTSKTDFLTRREQDDRIQRLQDSLKVVRHSIEDLNDEMSAYREEKNLLAANQKFRGDDKTLTVEEMGRTADFYRSRHQNINRAVTQRNREIVELNRRLFDLKLMLQELNAVQIPYAEIHLVVDADRAQQIPFSLHYVVGDAGWVALYDLEASESDKPITLRYRANAFNNTGVDWNDIKVTLTTIDPLESATQPRLDIWDLTNAQSVSNITGKDNAYQVQNNITIVNNEITADFKSMDNWYNMNQRGTDRIQQRQVGDFQRILGEDFRAGIDYETDLYKASLEDELSEGESTDGMVNVTFPNFNIDFPIKGLFSLPADNKPYALEINDFQLEVSYKYYAVPSLDKDAFLLAQIVGWEDLNLVSGPVNIYNQSEYIGQSRLDIRNISDTLNVSLGRDKSVVVTKVKVKGKTRRQLLGTTYRRSSAYNINVVNHKSNAIEIEVLDQMPISNNKEIAITVDELSGGILENKTGLVTWDMKLEPGARKTMDFGFTVKYPKSLGEQLYYAPSKKMRSMEVQSKMY